MLKALHFSQNGFQQDREEAKSLGYQGSTGFATHHWDGSGLKTSTELGAEFPPPESASEPQSQGVSPLTRRSNYLSQAVIDLHA